MIKKETFKKATDSLLSNKDIEKINKDLHNRFYVSWERGQKFAYYHPITLKDVFGYNEDLEAATKRNAYKVGCPGGIGFEHLINADPSMPKQLVEVYKCVEKVKKEFETVGFSDIDIVYENDVICFSKGLKPEMVHQFWFRIPVDVKHKENRKLMRCGTRRGYALLNHIVSNLRVRK